MQEHQLNVYDLPQEVDERELAGSTVIVIDLLRATSTICQALASGAREVVPFLEIEDALEGAKAADRANIVLGGERRGGKIPGFDVGNSPSEYTRDVVGGKRLFITTTNGTRAMHHARLAARIVLGSFLNLSAVVASVKDEPRIDILCAGTDGQETLEDFLVAGAIVDRIHESTDDCRVVNDAAQAARDEWQLLAFLADTEGRTLIEQLALELRHTRGGENLLHIGLDHDVVDCAQIDRLDIVPELEVSKWRIAVPSA